MIQFENVTKIYKGSEIVLDNISMDIPKGEIVVLIGPSGCGKTTCLKMINKLIKPSGGRILIDGKDIAQTDSTVLRREQGYVVQSTGLFPHMTVKENIEIIPTLQKAEKSSVEKRTFELMQMIGLNAQDYLHRYPTQLSGGQQQRIGVARAFATDPALILMDEPFSALDPITRSGLQDELLKLQHHFKKTIVFVTHDMDEAIKIADKICIMNKGKILQYDSPENVLKNPADKFVEDFVGKNRLWTQPEFIRAKDICINEPVTATKDTPLIKAVEEMRTRRVDSLLVTDDDNRLLGVVSVYRLHRGITPNTPILDIMDKEPKTVLPEANMREILEAFSSGVSILPVVDEHQTLSGLVTRSCMVNTLSRQFTAEEV